jgi:hypothetical protein
MRELFRWIGRFSTRENASRRIVENPSLREVTARSSEIKRDQAREIHWQLIARFTRFCNSKCKPTRLIDLDLTWRPTIGRFCPRCTLSIVGGGSLVILKSQFL